MWDRQIEPQTKKLYRAVSKKKGRKKRHMSNGMGDFFLLCNSGKRKKPVEERGSGRRLVDESQKTEEHLDNGARQRSASFVHISQELGSHAAEGERLHRTRAAESAAVGDREHGDCDDGVEDARETFDAGKVDGNHKRAVLCVCSRGVQQVEVIRRNDKAHDEKGKDVEAGDAPEDLFRCLRESLFGVGCLGCAQSYKLSAAKRE